MLTGQIKVENVIVYALVIYLHHGWLDICKKESDVKN